MPTNNKAVVVEKRQSPFLPKDRSLKKGWFTRIYTTTSKKTPSWKPRWPMCRIVVGIRNGKPLDTDFQRND